uniref:Nectarin-1 n=1 Tax=Solanum tuberosum TaxID=4113 RepID=M0ZLA7_SOLTU
MITNITKSSLFLLISIFTIVISRTTIASDPDILSDFTSPENQSSIDANYFTYTAMRGIFQKSVDKCTTTKATKAEFPVLNGQGVSLAVLQFPSRFCEPAPLPFSRYWTLSPPGRRFRGWFCRYEGCSVYSETSSRGYFCVS